jgi:hypothetical protein
MDRRQRRRELAGIVFGGLLLLTGGYYFLRNTLGFDLDVDWDMIWPIAVIALGAVILVGTFTHAPTEEPKP